MIPTPDYLGLFYPSKDLATPNAESPNRVVSPGSTQLSIITESLDEASDFWNGAVGFFCGQSTASLRGIPFHVRKWDKASGKLQITSPLPVVPVAGDMFKIFVGGKTASSQEVLAMKVSGKQPEVDPVTGPNVTGITIKKASAMLGTGTLEVRYEYSNRILRIRMNSGDYGHETILTGDAQNVPVYNKDLAGFILVDVVFASLRTSSYYSDTYTLTIPKGNLIPNFEGYETNDGFGRTRYHLAVAKNKAASALDAMNCFSLWTGKPKGMSTTLSSGYSPSYTAPQTMSVANASDWATRGFWIRNKTRNDLRYVDFRSSNTLYTKAIDWGIITFKTAQREITRGMRIDNYATSPSITAIVDQVILESGSWADKTASGTLHLKKYTSTSTFGTTSSIYSNGELLFTANGKSTRGFRGMTAQSWGSGDVIEPASDIDIGVNIPAGGYFRNPPDENTIPEGITFGYYPSQDECLIVESLAGGQSVGIWIRQTIIDGTQAREGIEGDINMAWY
ncbi:hypothetical protein FACS1894189_0640 [Planctomycetales bacterium]|nr:hypothetical protein FACS1894189_0640 [Planctomycetales bacterium]